MLKVCHVLLHFLVHIGDQLGPPDNIKHRILKYPDANGGYVNVR